MNPFAALDVQDASLAGRSQAKSSELATLVSSVAIVETHELTQGTVLPHPGIVLGLRYSGQATLVDPDSSKSCRTTR
jgi:hypothetical protein